MYCHYAHRQGRQYFILFINHIISFYLCHRVSRRVKVSQNIGQLSSSVEKALAHYARGPGLHSRMRLDVSPPMTLGAERKLFTILYFLSICFTHFCSLVRIRGRISRKGNMSPGIKECESRSNIGSQQPCGQSPSTVRQRPWVPSRLRHDFK